MMLLKSKIHRPLPLNFFFGLIFFSLIFSSCIVEVEQKNAETLKAEATQQIMALHDLQRTYHFEKKAEEFAAQLSADHISVNRGEIKNLTKEEHLTRFNNYFTAVEFEKWDDLNPPIIRFSDDYSMAYTIVDKEVVLTYEEDGQKKREQVKYAWVSIYKKHGDEWKIDCVGSTNKPSEITDI